MYGYAFAEHHPTAGGARQDDDNTSVSAVSSVASSDTASSMDDHVQDKHVAVPATTKRQRAKEIRSKVIRHCLRFIICYLIAGLVFLAILLPVIFLVIIPAIVQSVVSSQDIPINGGALVVQSPDTLLLSIDTSLKTPLPAMLSPLNLFLANGNQSGFNPFLNFTLPEKRISGTTPIHIVNQTVPITNATALTSWFADLYDQDEVKIKVHGKTQIALGKLKSKPHLDKTIEIKGLNKLDGFALDKLNLLFPPDQEGNNIKGTVLVPNHGVLTMSMGNVTFNIFSGTINIGFLTLRDVTLKPGNNTQAFDGQLHLNSVISNLGAVLASQSSALAKGNIDLTAQGNSTVVNGQHIKFIEDVINNRQLVAPVSIISLIGSVAGGILGGGSGGLDNAFGDVFGKNSSLIGDIAKHWNITAPSGNSTRERRQFLRSLVLKNMF